MTQNSTNLKVTNNADGYDISGGTTARKLTLTGADITLTGSGTNTYTFPASTSTLLATDGSIALLTGTIASAVLGNSTVYIGTTGIALNRGSAALTLAGLTLTTPDIGTPSAGVLTNCSGTASSLTAGAVTGFTPASGSLTLSGADALTITTTASTSITLPTSGTLLANVLEDTTPEFGGEVDAGAHTIGFTLQATTGDGTTTIDWKLGNKFKFTFGAQNETFTFTAPSNPCTLMLTLIQDSTGSRTATWPSTVKWAGGSAPTLTTTANARDKIALDWDGTQYDAVASLNFS